MILYLDPLEQMYRIVKENENMNKNDLITASLKVLFDQLNSIPPKLLKQVDEICLINYIADDIWYTDNNITLVLKKKKYNKHLLSLLDSITIENFNQKEYWTFFLNFIHRKKDIILFDTLLTHSIVSLAFQSIFLNNIKGYRNVEGEWCHIQNVEVYLSLNIGLVSLIKSEIEDNEISSAMVDYHFHSFIEFIHKHPEDKNYIYVSNRVNKNEREELIQALSKEFGFFDSFNCKNWLSGYGTTHSTDKIPKGERIYLYNFEKISNSDQIEIINATNKRDDLKLFIIITTSFEDISAYQFKVWNVITREIGNKLVEIRNSFIRSLAEVLQRFIETYQFITDKLTDNSRLREEMILRYDLYFPVKDFFSPSLSNFWYECYKEGYINIDHLMKELFTEISMLTHDDMNVDNFKIYHDQKYWYIIKNNDVENQVKIEYAKANNIKYLVYLYKHYSYGEGIYYWDLENVVNNWDRKDNEWIIKDKSEISFNSIQSSISAMFSSRKKDKKNKIIDKSAFKPLSDSVYLNYKDFSCTFLRNQNYQIELSVKNIPDKLPMFYHKK